MFRSGLEVRVGYCGACILDGEGLLLLRTCHVIGYALLSQLLPRPFAGHCPEPTVSRPILAQAYLRRTVACCIMRCRASAVLIAVSRYPVWCPLQALRKQEAAGRMADADHDR